MLKSYRVGWWGGGGGPCDYCVSPSPFDLDFGTLDSGTSVSVLTTATLGFSSFTKFNNFVQFIFEKKSFYKTLKLNYYTFVLFHFNRF